MDNLTDQELLRDYADRRSEAAFAELVRRHIDFVYSAALRMVCDAHLAQDVAQGVFVALAQNAPQLVSHPVLSGWLHRTAQNLAANTVRANVRRTVREQEAVAMNELLSPQTEAPWERIAPYLDAALGELSEPDRDAVLLRYFERKTAHEMAQILSTSDEAAQKRVSRAVERLRELFAKRGVTVGAGGLVVVISANAVQAAPPGLATTISTSAVVTAKTSTAATITKAIIMTTFQKTLVATTIALLAIAGSGIYFVQHRQPALETFSGTNDFVIRWGQTTLSCMTALSSDRQIFIFVTPNRADDSSHLSIQLKIMEMTGTLKRFPFLRSESITNQPIINSVTGMNVILILGSDQYAAVVKAMLNTGKSTTLGMNLESVVNGKETTVGLGTFDGVSNTIAFLPKISSDGDSVALRIIPNLHYLTARDAR